MKSSTRPLSSGNELLKIAIWITAGLVVIFGVLLIIGQRALPGKEYAFPDGDLPRHLAGRWDWQSHDSSCAAGAHVIGFSPDRRVMTITLPPHGSDTGWVATYDVTGLKSSRLTGAIRGETRLTSKGKPVVWDLIMFGPDEYRWHRTDWAASGYTGAVVRCD